MSIAHRDTNQYIVSIEVDERGKRTATRTPLHASLAVTLALVAEELGERTRLLASEPVSDRAINDTIKDMRHELNRRAGTLAELGEWGARPGMVDKAHR